MTDKKLDFRDCPTAYECRDRLPELASWLSEEALKELPIWRGTRFERGRTYFDLTNPERGAFSATGDEGQPTNHTFVSREEIPEKVWALLVTWRQPVSPDQGQAIETLAENREIEPDREGPPGPYAAH